jgi:cell division topological specificity factor
VFKTLKKVLFGDNNESKDVAKSRLHFVLVQDRTGLNNDEMSGFREEMLKVIEKYFVIDKDGFDIKYHRLQDTTTLLINSPVIVRRVGAPAPTPPPATCEVAVEDGATAVASNI